MKEILVQIYLRNFTFLDRVILGWGSVGQVGLQNFFKYWVKNKHVLAIFDCANSLCAYMAKTITFI